MEETDHKQPFLKEDRKDNYARSDRAPRVPREREFRGFYVDTARYGGDALKAYRKLKRMYKDTRFFEEMRERQYYQKPAERRREDKKRRKQTLARLQRERRILYGNTPQKHR